MKNWFFTVFTLLLFLLGYVLYTFVSTGYFRETSPTQASIKQVINLSGVEDIDASYIDEFLILSSDDRAARRDGKPVQGALYKLSFENADQYSIIPLTEDLEKKFYPHGISLLKINDSTFRIWAINHFNGKHTIEVFDLIGNQANYIKTIASQFLVSPNDLTALGPDEFYFTNDHGNTSNIGVTAENYLGLRASNAYHYKNGTYKKVADDIAYANGITHDNERNLLFLASPRDFLIKVYKIENDKSLTFIENIDCETGVDNIEIDPDGLLWVGCHPSLLQFTSYAAGKRSTSGSEVITIDYKSKGNYKINQIMLDNGENISASTVAVPMHGLVFIGNVMDDHIIAIENEY